MSIWPSSASRSEGSGGEGGGVAGVEFMQYFQLQANAEAAWTRTIGNPRPSLDDWPALQPCTRSRSRAQASTAVRAKLMRMSVEGQQNADAQVVAPHLVRMCEAMSAEN